MFQQTSTDRVVWSFAASDPPNPDGQGAAQHIHQGSRSINLIGGLAGEANPTPVDADYYDARVTNVSLYCLSLVQL